MKGFFQWSKHNQETVIGQSDLMLEGKSLSHDLAKYWNFHAGQAQPPSEKGATACKLIHYRIKISNKFLNPTSRIKCVDLLYFS